MSDVLSFFDANYEGQEFHEGFAGEDLTPPQWGLAKVMSAEYRLSAKSETPGIRMGLQLDAKMAKTPGKYVWYDLWLTPGYQPFIDGVTVALGLGRMTVRIGKPKAGSKDERAPIADVGEFGPMLAASLKEREAIIALSVEKDEQYGDKNRIEGWHKPTEENLAAIAEANFDFDLVKKRTKKEGNKEVRYLVAKKGGEVASAKAGAPKTIE